MNKLLIAVLCLASFALAQTGSTTSQQKTSEPTAVIETSAGSIH